MLQTSRQKADMGQSTEVILFPDFGELGADGEPVGKVWVIEVPLRPGDFVMPEDTLLTVESHKATLDVPAPKAGKLLSLLVKVGDEVTKNTPIAEFEPLNASRQNFSVDHAYERELPSDSNAVFLVHGHDVALREMSARLIEKLGLKVIILGEQASRGATIIEKLEEHSSVQFAVVLMTADDVGAKKADSPGELQSRARQNVVLELGYFIGKIGRQRVCVLYESGVELPSDYYGVVFIPIDDHGMWRYALAKEFNQAGLQVDLNRL
uniref:TIR domain-containing protein n=1 Tax=Cupriavidus necator TaxID=106590 RepID=UPI003F497468